MTNPTDEELDAVAVKTLGLEQLFEGSAVWTDGRGTIVTDETEKQPASDWNALLAAVAKLEEETGWAFERDKEGFWRAIKNDGTGEIYTSMFWFSDGTSETRALALCIYAAVNQ